MVTVSDLRTHSLAGVVQREIESMILSGELAPGERLNEKVVADKLMISRGPVREACRALAELGLVYLIPNRGVFISQLSRADAIEVYDMRAGLTALASRLVCPRMTEALLGQLDGIIEAMDAAAEGADFPGFHGLNVEFHDVLVRATENGRLIRTYRALVKEFQLFRRHGAAERASLLESNREHRAIVGALKAGDPEASFEATFRHVTRGKIRMLEALDALQRQPDQE
jgi:DNA-binding GntR family transcriptional regulator